MRSKCHLRRHWRGKVVHTRKNVSKIGATMMSQRKLLRHKFGRVAQSSKQNVFLVTVANRSTLTRLTKEKVVCSCCCSSHKDAAKWPCFTSMYVGERRLLACKRLQLGNKVKQRSEAYLIGRKIVLVKYARGWMFLKRVCCFCFACMAMGHQKGDQNHQVKSRAQMCERM